MRSSPRLVRAGWAKFTKPATHGSTAPWRSRCCRSTSPSAKSWLKFATQIADALDRAHRAGVTHRDVKPQNMMLTRDGVKVLAHGTGSG